MITLEQALTMSHFYCLVFNPRNPHYHDRKKAVKTVRRSGKTQTWKTRPDHFRVPVKFGLYESLEITHENANEFFATETDALQHFDNTRGKK